MNEVIFSMRDNKKRAMSLFLSAMMTLSLIPTAAFAAEPDNVLFDIAPELTQGSDGAGDEYNLIADGSEQDVTFQLGFTGVEQVDTFAAVIDYSALNDYITVNDTGRYNPSVVPADVTMTVDGQPVGINAANTQFGPGTLNGVNAVTTGSVVMYSTSNVLFDMTDAAKLTIGLDADLQPGVYPIEVTVYQLRVREGEEPIVLDNAGTHQKTTVELRVADENGDVPGVGDDEETTVTITKGKQENGTFTAPDSVKPGESFDVIVDPADGYTPVAGDVTVSGPEGVAVGEPTDNGDGTWTYPVTVPADVKDPITVNLTVSETPAEMRAITYSVISDSEGVKTGEFRGAVEAEVGSTVEFTMVPTIGYGVEATPTVSIDGNGGTVEVTQVGEPTAEGAVTYSFVMPDGAVTVSGSFERTVGTISLGEGTILNCEIDFNGVTAANIGDTVVVYVKPNSGFTLNNERAGIQLITSGASLGHDDFNVTGPTTSDVKPGYYEYRFTIPEDPAGASSFTVHVNATAVEGADPLPDKYSISTVINESSDGTPYGTVTIDGNKTEAAEGETVRFTVAPNQGFETTIESISVTHAGGSITPTAVVDQPNTYEFQMPAASVQINVTFQESGDDNEDQYDITISSGITGGKVYLQEGHSGKADAGDTVTIYIDADDGNILDTIYVSEVDHEGTSSEARVDISDVQDVGENQPGIQYIMFTMPASDVRVNAVFKEDGSTTDPDDPEIPTNKVRVSGLVQSQYDKPIPGATVIITPTGSGSEYRATAGADGRFSIDVDSGVNYQIHAEYDVGVKDGEFTTPGQICSSQVADITLTGSSVSGGDEYPGFVLEINLKYDWDVDNDQKDESIFPGEDHKFLDTVHPDYYHKDIVNAETTEKKDVIVYADDTGDIQSTDSYYWWDVNQDSSNEQVFVGEDFRAGTQNDFYQATLDFMLKPSQQTVNVYIGDDHWPGTDDDYYNNIDVNNDGVNDTVYAGADGIIGTSDDWYDVLCQAPGTDQCGETIRVYIGDDNMAGSYDDYYFEDTDGDGEDEQVWVGDPDDTNPDRDRLPHTLDDNYVEDVNNDGQDEHIFAGEDGKWNTSDDFYEDVVGGRDVIVFPGETGDPDDPYDFGTPVDHYEFVIGGETVTVYVGDDTQAGTDDDWFEYGVPKPGTEVDDDGNPVAPVEDVTVTVDVGEDGVPGTSDDTYELDADMDGEDELVHVGPDGVPGTSDDYYDEDKNGNGDPERVEAGDDGIFGTPDDFYEDIVNTPDGTQEKVPVYAGEDGVHSPANDPDNDDWYPWDTNEDGVTDPDIYDGEDTHDKVFIDGDSFAGTEDDYYFEDVDGDGEDEKVWVGDDTIPGTEDDYYKEDINGDGEDEDHFPGEDGDWDQPGEEDTDDYYEVPDIDGDGDPEQVHPGDDTILGTPDDWYEADIDDDGKDEIVYVGDDKVPGTDDDWYYADITFNATPGTVNGASTWTVLTSELTSLPTASRSGSYSFVGWSLSSGSSSTLTLEQIKGMSVDTVVYAYYRYTGGGSSGGGGGGGGGGGSTSSSYTIRFDSNGGSSVSSQTVRRNGTVDEPRDPTRDGYTFTGWYTDDDCTDLYDFDTKVTKSFTLYAGWKEETVSDRVFRYLTNEHISYIAGFDDGMVHGDVNMTRAQVATVFYRLLNDETRAEYGTSYNRFTDVDSGAWYNTAVSTLSNLGIVAGYGNGKFGPNDPITRAQFATICARIGELEASGENHFTDVPTTHWAYEYINAAADEGWVAGYGDGRFGPDDTITRSQVVVMLNRVLERDELTLDSFAEFEDEIFNWPDNNDPTAWDYLPLIEAGNGHEYDRDSNGEEVWTELH